MKMKIPCKLAQKTLKRLLSAANFSYLFLFSIGRTDKISDTKNVFKTKPVVYGLKNSKGERIELNT
jgi:hypothetical protein